MAETPHAARADEDRGLKTRHRATWASGDYDAVLSCVGVMSAPQHQAAAPARGRPPQSGWVPG